MTYGHIKEKQLQAWEQQSRAVGSQNALDLIAAYRHLRRRCHDQELRLDALLRDRNALAAEVRQLRDQHAALVAR